MRFLLIGSYLVADGGKFSLEICGRGVRRQSQETEWQPGGARLLRVHRCVAGLRANFRGGFQAGLTPSANSEIEVGDSEAGGDWRGTKSSPPESSSTTAGRNLPPGVK